MSQKRMPLWQRLVITILVMLGASYVAGLGDNPEYDMTVLRLGYESMVTPGSVYDYDVDTGERLWKRGRYGHGQLILVGDLLLVQTEQGAVVLVEATPEGHRELGRLEALRGKTWNAPALAGRYLLVRNNREAACYELPVE